MDKFDYIKKRYSEMSSDRGTWEDHWQEILDYVMPRKADVVFVRVKGDKRTEVLFDSTAITANNLLAASLQGTLTSPSLQWFHLKIRDDEINQDRDVKLWLEDTAKRMYAVFNKTNFTTEVHEIYLSNYTIGKECLCVKEGKQGYDIDSIHFKTMNISEFYIGENVSGYKDCIDRRDKLTARQAIKECGEENEGTKIQEAARMKPDKKIEYIQEEEKKEDKERA